MYLEHVGLSENLAPTLCPEKNINFYEKKGCQIKNVLLSLPGLFATEECVA
jgi:hypothetical protein